MLTKVHSKINAFFVAMTTMVVLSIDAGMAHAAETLGARAKSITGEVDSFKELALGLSILVGVILVAVGIIKLVKDSRGGEGGVGTALIWIIAGVLMAGIPILLAITGQSVLGKEIGVS